MYAVNVRAPFFLIQDAARIMRRGGAGGTIVNILSTSAHGGQHFLAAYSSSKGALGILTRNVAYALLRDGIRINGLNIGWMNTPGEHTIQKLAHDSPPDWLDKAGAGLPLGRLLDPARGGAGDGVPALGREHADERRADRLRPVGAGRGRPAAADDSPVSLPGSNPPWI